MRTSRIARALPVAADVLAAAAATAGIIHPDLYRDNAFVRAAWRGNDLVTLSVAVPLCAWAWRRATRGSMRASLVLVGLMAYLFYAYCYYLFGAAFNVLFLAYVGICVTSGIAVVSWLLPIDAPNVKERFKARTPVRVVSAYLLVVAIGLSLVYVTQTAVFVLEGHVPAIVTLTDHPTSLVFAIDLTFLVPALVAAGAWLWRRQPWGYVTAAIVLVVSPVYTLGLALGTWLAARTAAGDLQQLPLWALLTTTSGVAALFFFRNMHDDIAGG